MKKKKVAKKKKPVKKVAKPTDNLKNPKEELFCVLYVSNTSRQFFGNAQNCYAEAYGFQDRLDAVEVALTGHVKKPRSVADEDTEDGDETAGDDMADNATISKLQKEKKKIQRVCQTLGSRLLSKVEIRKRCEYFLNQYLSNEVVDRELAYTAVQRYDLRSKVAAIDSYNKLRRRLVDDDTKPQKVIVDFRWDDPEPRPKPKVTVKTK